MRLPDGRVVPQVSSYKHLGSEEKDSWGEALAKAREKVVGKCTQLLGMIGKVGVMDE